MVGVLFLIAGAQYRGQGPAPLDALYLVPNTLVDALGERAIPVHRYGDVLLAEVPELITLPRRLQSRLTAVRAVDRIAFRGFEGPIEPWSRNQVEGLPEGYYLMAFVGPVDARWTRELESLGLGIVESAPPYALLVRGRGEDLARAEALTTSFGYAAVRSVKALPIEARLDPALLDLVRGAASAGGIPGLRTTSQGLVVVRTQTHPDRTSSSVARDIERAPQEISRGRPDVFAVEPAELLRLLEDHPEVAYIEAVPERELHDNLAAKTHIMDVESVWTEPSLGYDGTGVIVGHNDTGVDLSHPDFPAGVVLATAGAMSGTDNAHGTHTAGSVLGRGLAASSPTNTSGCGDGTAPLPTVRGMAWGARLVTNNAFVGGQFSELSMMRWSYQQGARISTNSWGYDSLFSYSSHAAAVDELVRDADSTAPGNQELLIYFSAGNDGPASGTVSSPGTAKNVVTIGASQNDRCGAYVPSRCSGPDIDSMACFSSRGPAQGRVKPDLVAPGTDVLAPESSDPLATKPLDQSWTGAAYATKSGTSMATPLSAGAGAAFFEFYKDRFGSFPSPALAKAALVNGAVDMGLGYPSFAQGWGRLNLRNAIEGPPQGAIRFFDQTETLPLGTGQFWTASFQVFSNSTPIETTLVWTDPPGPPGSTSPLVNDLNLLVIDPVGTIYRGNQLTDSWSTPDPGPVTDTANNVENVFVRTPLVGSWTIQVSSARTASNPPGSTGQDFALVYSGDAGDCVPPPAPGGLVASAPVSNRIDLTWTPEPSAVSYKVYRSETSGGGFVELASGSTASYSDLTVSGGTTYFYRVTAVNATGCESAPSMEVSALANGDCTLPPEFDGLASVSSSGTTTCALDLSWDPARSACSGSEPPVYNVYRSTVSGFTPGPSSLIDVCVAATSYTDTNVSSGTTYYYVVRAEDASAAGGGPCRGGHVDANVVEKSGTPAGVATTLYSNDFEGADDFVHAPEVGGLEDSWQGIQTSCPAASGAGIYRFGGASCSADYSLDNFASAGPSAPVSVPAGALNVRMNFSHRWELEQDGSGVYDGGYLAASVDGSAFVPVQPPRLSGTVYNAVLDGVCSSAFGTHVFSGTSSGYASNLYLDTSVDLDGVCDDVLAGTTGCAGHDVSVRFTAVTDCAVTRTGWFIDDVSIIADVVSACTGAPDPVLFFTVTSTDGMNRLEWLNSSSGGDVTLRYRTDQSPASPTDGTSLTPPPGTPGSHQQFVHQPLANGTSYYYGAFVENGAGAFSAGRFAEGRPDGSIAGGWVYQTGASAVSPLAPGPSTVHGVSNDQILHGMVGGVGEGVWPANWMPVMLNAPEARPPILPFAIGGASRVLLATTLDGTVTAVDADTGARVWTSAVLAERFTGSASAMLSSFGGNYDLAFVGTRNTSAANSIIALRLSDGLFAWQFDNGGGANAIGIIGASAAVRYGSDKIVFASRTRAGGTSNTLWSISFTDTGAVLEWARALGDIDGSPVLWGDRVYVGTNDGKVYAVDAETGADVWPAPFDTSDGPVKGYIWPGFGTGAIYFSTTNTVTALVDEGATVTEKWSVTSIPSPSTPALVPGTNYLYVGGGDGRLHRLDVTTSPPTSSATMLGDGSAAAGSPSISINENMLYIGTTSGAIHALPLVP